MIERNIFLTEKRRIEPLDVVYGSDTVGVKLNILDFNIPNGATAKAHARAHGSGVTYESDCTITDSSVSFYPAAGFFLPGRNALQVDITLPNGHALSFVMDAFCDPDVVEGDAHEAQSVKSALERAEALLAEIIDADAITAEEIDAAYDYGTEYEVIDDKEY